MWYAFRAIAARIGLSPAKVAEVERAGVETYIADPFNSEIEYRVRPDANWTERLECAWKGTLVNSRQEVAGTIPIGDGLLTITNADVFESGITVRAAEGEYEVTLTVAYEGEEKSGDYAEHVSHAFAVLRNRRATLIEPLEDENGTEIGVSGADVAFASSGVFPGISGDHAGLWSLRLSDLFYSKLPDSTASRRTSVRLADDNGSGVAIIIQGGYGRSDYPIYRMSDEEGRTIGLMIDFFVDNRP